MIARNSASSRPTANGRSRWACCGAPVVDFTYHKCAPVVPAERGQRGQTRTNADKPATKRPRAGHVTEALLCAALDKCGLIDAVNAEPTTPAASVYVREFAWGIYLPEPRLFRFDAAVPARRLAFEADGGAHYATKRQGKADTERRGIAAAHGWRIVAVTPEQVKSGEAVALVRDAIEFSKAATAAKGE